MSVVLISCGVKKTKNAQCSPLVSLVVIRTLFAGPDRNQVASRLARRLASSTLGPLIAFSVKHEQFISRFSPSQGSPRGQRINLRHESPAVPASSICPNLFLTLPPRKVPPSLYRRWKLSGSVFSHHPRVSTIVFAESFMFVSWKECLRVSLRFQNARVSGLVTPRSSGFPDDRPLSQGRH